MRMEENPRLNQVRMDSDGVLEFFDGTDWIPYPDVPDTAMPPIAVARDNEPR